MLVPSLAVFNRLPLQTQIGIVLTEGLFLGNRLGEHGHYLNLYHVGDFFAELTYDADRNRMRDCHTFRNGTQLQAYANGVDLSRL